MRFLWPYMLWLFAIIPIVVALYILALRRRRKATLRYATLSIVKQAMQGRSFRRHVPPIILLIALAAMIFGVSRPTMVITLPSQRGTIIMAMDISGSMRANDVDPNRITAAQNAARTFIAGQPSAVRLGVVAFAGTSTIVQAPTDSKEEVLAAIDLLRTQRGTAIGSGILASLDAIFEGLDVPMEFTPTGRGTRLGRIEDIEAPDIEPVEPGSYRSAIVVLLTDGQTTQGPDPLQAAQIAADLGVRIFTVGLGTPEGVTLGFGGRSFRVILDESTLRAIADTTDAEYYRASSETDLQDIYRNLSTELIFDTEQTEITVFATALATALVLVGAILSIAWFGRIA